MPGPKAMPDGSYHLQHFDDKDDALAMMDTFDYMLKHHKDFKDLNLIASRPRPERGGWAVYAIPRPN